MLPPGTAIIVDNYRASFFVAISSGGGGGGGGGWFRRPSSPTIEDRTVGVRGWLRWSAASHTDCRNVARLGPEPAEPGRVRFRLV